VAIATQITANNLIFIGLNKYSLFELNQFFKESKKNDEIWDILLNYEALILLPNYKPNKCNTENCNSLICNFCYKDKKNIICLECKNLHPTLP
jgi:hypothetical protein